MIAHKDIDPIDGMQFLAREFFIWLWWMTDQGGRFMDDGDEIAVSFIDRMVMGPGTAAASLGCGGKLSMDFRDPSDRTEARAALAAGMEPIQVKLLLNRITSITEPDDSKTTVETKWIFALDVAFNFQRVVVPTIPLAPEDTGDAKAGLFEHLALLDAGESILRRLFREFLNVRLSDSWTDTAEEITDWIGGNGVGWSREIQLCKNSSLALFAMNEFTGDDRGYRFCETNDVYELVGRVIAKSRKSNDSDAGNASVDADEEQQERRRSGRARGVGRGRRGKTFAEELASSFGMEGVTVESSETVDANGVLRMNTVIRAN